MDRALQYTSAYKITSNLLASSRFMILLFKALKKVIIPNSDQCDLSVNLTMLILKTIYGNQRCRVFDHKSQAKPDLSEVPHFY